MSRPVPRRTLTYLVAIPTLILGVIMGLAAPASASTPGQTYGHIDALFAVPGGIHVTGWVFRAPNRYVDVTVSIGGHPVTHSTHVYRPDVARAMHTGYYHGFSFGISATTGRHKVCVTAPGLNFGCWALTVAIPSVGPLFTAGLAAAHGCTAAVVTSTKGNVILTAAHCISGTGAGIVFVPGYDKGRAPYGSWTVRHTYLSPAWLQRRDPTADYAFLTVTPSASNPTRRSVQAAVGGNTLSTAPRTGQRVLVEGYVAGRNDEPVTCSGSVYYHLGYPAIYCRGLADGTSGSPWLANYSTTTRTGTITAVVGGYYHGGCTVDTSYSSPFNATTTKTLMRAESGAAPDIAPTHRPSGC